MRDALAERQTGPGAHQQRQFFERRIEDDGLSARIPRVSVKIVPARFVIRQPDAALALPGFDDAGDQQVAAQQEVVALFEGLRVVLVVEEGRAQHRLVVGVRLPEQGVEIRQQAVAQLNRAANGRRDARIHPRLVHRVVIVPRVNGKARVHHAVLHPAHEQLGVRLVAGETADVVPDVEQPGQAHAQPHADVIAQGVPVGAVVAAPGLDVALHPGAAGAGDEIRAFFRRKALLRFQRGAHHQQRHHRANMLDGDLLAEAKAAGFPVPHFIFVIVVPGGVDAHLQQLRGDAVLPPLHRLRVGKVEV